MRNIINTIRNSALIKSKNKTRLYQQVNLGVLLLLDNQIQVCKRKTTKPLQSALRTKSMLVGESIRASAVLKSANTN